MLLKLSLSLITASETMPKISFGSVRYIHRSVTLELLNEFDDRAVNPLRTISGTDISCLQGGEIMPGTDLVSIKRTAGSSTVKNGEREPASALKNNQWYLRIGDYGEEKSWLYHRSGGLPAADIGSGTGVDYWEFYARIFYIRKFSEAPTDEIPTLCVEGLTGGLSLGVMATRCLVEGVEDMQIELGIDSDFDGVPNQFKAAPEADEVANAVAARIHLLLRSIDTIPGHTKAKTYQLGSKSVAYDDRYLRRVFSTTVQIRNATLAAG